MDLIDCDIYEVSFNRIGEKKGQKPDVGQRIMETISFAMTRFIEKYNCPIIFICDSLDNKHLGRMRRFNTWYNKLENKALFTFEAKELYSIEEEFTYYTGMVIQNNHPKLIELIIEFDNPEIFKQKI